MTDNQQPTAEQQAEWIQKALSMTGFERAPVDGIFFKTHSDTKKIVVDITAGVSVYFKMGTEKVEDPKDLAIISVVEMIDHAKEGIMPSTSEPDFIYSREVPAEPVNKPTVRGGQPITPESKEDVQNPAGQSGYEPDKQPPKSRGIQEMPELSIEIVKKYINEKVTNEEAYKFIEVCRARNLNPFLGQVHIAKKEFTGTAKIIVGKDGFMEMSERNPQKDGFEAGIIIQKKDKSIIDVVGSFKEPEDILLGGWAKVYRKDRSHCFESRVSMKEYDTGKASWGRIPATMIRKVALVQGHREAYPSELSGIYDSSEMGTEEST